MNSDKTIENIYRILNDVTPLKTDCGNLCGNECCKGDDSIGMILFPGEEKRFSDEKSFKILNLNGERKVVVCSGKCNRNLRPISCRIFPLFPALVDGEIYVIDDPRASGVCPLLYDEIKLEKKFENAIYKVGLEMTKNEETRVFLENLTKEISDIISMQYELFK